MSDLNSLFNGDEPPTARDLTLWIKDNYDVPDEVVDRIVTNFLQAQWPGYTWTPQKLDEMVTHNVDAYERGLPTPRPPDVSGDKVKVPSVTTPTTAQHDRATQSAAAASTAASERADRMRQRSIPSWIQDDGPSVDPNALATSLAIGVFADASGNPQIDPDTGAPVPVNAQTLWEAIKGTRFDMGSLALNRTRPLPSDEREGAQRVSREVQRRRFVTPSSAMAMLNGLTQDYLISLQQQMWEAGLFGDKLPSWGIADEDTRRAFMGVFAESSLTPDVPIDQVIARLIDERVSRTTEAAGTGANKLQVPAFSPEVASPETLGGLIDDISSDLFGKFANPDAKAALITKLQGKETDTQRAQYDQQVAEAQRQSGAGAPGEIDAFMAAISGQESGGNYNAVNATSGASGKFQIMPANWGPWAEKAGIGRNAPRTPQNQEIVAKHMMGEYYAAFGNWRDVAIAWYAGPGRVGTAAKNLNAPQGGYPSINAYADKVMDRFANLRGTGVDPGLAGAYPAIERFDPAAEAEAILRAQDPVGWQGHEFAKRASEFYGLLRSPI